MLNRKRGPETVIGRLLLSGGAFKISSLTKRPFKEMNEILSLFLSCHDLWPAALADFFFFSWPLVLLWSPISLGLSLEIKLVIHAHL